MSRLLVYPQARKARPFSFWRGALLSSLLLALVLYAVAPSKEEVRALGRRGEWLRSLRLDPPPVAGQESRLILEVAPDLQPPTQSVDVTVIEFPGVGLTLGKAEARGTSTRMEAQVQWSRAGLLSVALVRRTAQGPEESSKLLLPLYVSRPGGPQGAWLDPNTYNPLRMAPSPLEGRSPVMLAEWVVALGQQPVVVGQEASVTLVPVGSERWWEIEAQALGLKPPDHLEVLFRSPASRQSALRVRALPVQDVSLAYRLSVLIPPQGEWGPSAGVWQLEPVPIIGGQESLWVRPGTALVVEAGPAPPTPTPQRPPSKGELLPIWLLGLLWGVLGVSLAAFAAYRLGRRQPLD